MDKYITRATAWIGSGSRLPVSLLRDLSVYVPRMNVGKDEGSKHEPRGLVAVYITQH
jgi:hypothetical protein